MQVPTRVPNSGSSVLVPWADPDDASVLHYLGYVSVCGQEFKVHITSTLTSHEREDQSGALKCDAAVLSVKCSRELTQLLHAYHGASVVQTRLSQHTDPNALCQDLQDLSSVALASRRVALGKLLGNFLFFLLCRNLALAYLQQIAQPNSCIASWMYSVLGRGA
jgi:hypothetical protein